MALLALARPALAQEGDRWDARWEAAWDRGYYHPAPPCSVDLRALHATREGHGEWAVSAVLLLPWAGCRGARIEPAGAMPLEPSAGLEPPAALEPEGEPLEVEGGLSAPPRWPLLPVVAPDGGRGSDIDVGGGVEAAQVAPSESRPVPAPLTPSWVREVANQAVRAAGFERMERALDEQASRARTSGLLPELRLRGAVGLDNTNSLAGAGLYPGEATWRGGTDGAAEVRLTFRLNRLVFDDGEPGLERLRLQLLQARQKLVENVLELLYAWQRARLRELAPEQSDEERALAAIQVEELAMRLQVMTGGWFGSPAALATRHSSGTSITPLEAPPPAPERPRSSSASIAPVRLAF